MWGQNTVQTKHRRDIRVKKYRLDRVKEQILKLVIGIGVIV